MADDEHPDPYIALIPGGGWMIHHRQEPRTPDTAARVILGRETVASAEWSEPVVAWALLASGDVIPLEADHDGTVWPVRGPHEGYEFWHPDSSAGRSQDHLREYREQLEAGGN